MPSYHDRSHARSAALSGSSSVPGNAFRIAIASEAVKLIGTLTGG
ncbi:MAG: hypothetical protein ABGU97_00195 [Xylella fastidiosa subsp. multiplex]|nr:hypothetical protein [Xylella fastidiosa]